MQNMEVAVAETAREMSSESLPDRRMEYFNRQPARAVAIGNARVKMERAVKHAEHLLLEKKRLETALMASREEQAEIIAEELYHNPGTILGQEEIAYIYEESGCEALQEEVDCTVVPFYYSIRTATGVCNHLEHSTWGASFTPYVRIIAAQYADGINAMHNQADEPDLGAFVPTSPSGRIVSSTVEIDREINDTRLTHLSMEWGQFLDHDIHQTARFPSPKCDLENCVQDEICAPIRVPDDDPKFGIGTYNNGKCLGFERSIPACDDNPFDFTARAQLNKLSHFIDMSMLYGHTESLGFFLREHRGGRLKHGANNGLPVEEECPPEEDINGATISGGETPEECCPPEYGQDCGGAGDARALESVPVTALYIVFLREHNRVANGLAAVNPHWDDERIFVEAREIVIAEAQRITMYEYVRTLLGDENFNKFIGPYRGYNPMRNPTIPNGFATAAGRVGHSQLQPAFERLKENGESIERGPLPLYRTFWNPKELFLGGGPAPYIRGLIKQPSRALDEFVTNVMTSRLFEEEGVPGSGRDIVSLDVQRSRDHGHPRYGIWKNYCKNTCGIESDFTNELTALRLQQVYGSHDNIDLLTAGLAEEPLPGGAFGALLTCLWTTAFNGLRDGDRFWYENQDPDLDLFTPEQLAEIQKTSSASIFCDNVEITKIQACPFYLDETGEHTVPCEDISRMDFEPWREIEPCFYRATVTAQEDTVVSFFNRPSGSGKSDLRAFHLKSSMGETSSRCIPHHCPVGNEKRDIIVTTTKARKHSCEVVQSGRPNFNTVITQEMMNDHPALFSSQAACEASNEAFVDVKCDQLEMARITNTGMKKAGNLMPTKLEKPYLTSKMYDQEDLEILSSTTALPISDLPVST
jgi:hypothetical protein